MRPRTDADEERFLLGQDQINDPFAQGDDDAALSRREFLERTAYAAGLAGMAAALPASTLITEAARAESRTHPLPSPRNLPIDTFVLVMMENRSFDHYFGWTSPYADGQNKQTYIDGNTGQPVSTYRATRKLDDPYQGCGFGDPGHGWDDGRAQLKNGFLAKNSGNDEFALSYYREGELGFIQPAAAAYTLYDRYFCSLLAGTYPNRYYKWSAQSGGIKDNSLPVNSLGRQWETIFDRAATRNPANIPGGGGPTYRYYNSDLPFSALFGTRGIGWTRPVAQYYADCAAGTLPNIVIVDPPFRDGGGGDGISADEHPLGDVRLGQAFMSDIAHAFLNSPHYRRGAMFLIYDEWGGFFDHVKPPSVADDRQSSNLDKDFGRMGFRIPAVTISPYTRNHPEQPRVSHMQAGHESILKLIEYRYGLGNLVTRDAMTNNIGRSFDFNKHDFDVPDLPDPADPVTAPCSLGGGGGKRATTPHDQDMENLANYAEGIGYNVGSGKPEHIFSQPDRVLKAYRASTPDAPGT
jgi:phospholipase C